ncbi:MAG: hypothetical protein KC438_02800 [Thermomicrobiales bacterium]|nr:hypothetical protein [Thermomicrobiales bacterium]
MDQKLSRRQLGALAAPLALAIAAGRGAGISLAQDSDTPLLAPTPACGDAEDFAETRSQTEGPYFTPNSPERMSLLEDGMPGTKLVVTGYVYSTDCTPIEDALVDFWQCDDAGVYDNVGYTLRGHQFTDADGRYELTTIVPGNYPGRTRHIHVKAQKPNADVLTSQLYFPDEPGNESDGIFDPSLVMDLADAEDGEGKAGFFTFVLA